QTKLSKLGEILFLEEEPPLNPDSDGLEEYTILIWKYGRELKKRHVMRFTERSYDPFENCSVKNCVVRYKKSYISSADLVIFDLNHIKGTNELPLKSVRNPNQIWAFLSDRSPLRTFSASASADISDFDDIFNWSMTYRMNSDIPVPYGQTLLLRHRQKHLEIDYEEWNKSKHQNILLAIVMSDCRKTSYRLNYIKELQKHLKIDIYGNCGNKRCKAYAENIFPDELIDCEETIKYKFYLAFENSNCDEFITEQVWWYAYSKNAIPIVMGGSKKYYEQLLPPHSYINTEKFARPRDLVNYIVYLNNTPSDILQYFVWKKYFKVVNEHGYFHTASQHYCRACEALNYNNKDEKTIHDMEDYWVEGKCHSSSIFDLE
ncbi:hypothetical protein ILUMI_00965, partial [Ignelater luminosus]